MTTEITPTETTTKRDKGFTLVELLIVIAILGVLATITVLSVRGISNNSKSSTCASDRKTLEVAIESYYASNGSSATTPTEALLVSGRLLQSASTNMDINASGAVIVQSGSGC